MGIMDRFTGIFKGEDEYENDGYDENYEEDYDEPAERESETVRSSAPSRDVRSSGGVSASSLEMKVIKPEKFEQVTVIADHLLSHRTIVLNLEETNKETIRRIIDFMSGVAFAIEGNIKRVASSTYVITPKNVEVSGEQKEREETAHTQRELF